MLAGIRSNLEQVLIPLVFDDVVQQRPRSVGAIRDVALPAREVPDQPAVDRPERKLALLGQRTRPVDMIENPRNLCSGEVWVDQETSLVPDHLLVAVVAKLRAEFGGPSILPHDRVVDRLTRLAIPYDRRLALVRNADRRDIAWPHVRPGKHLDGGRQLRGKDVDRVMLDPAGVRILLFELMLGDACDLALVIEEHGT